MAQDEITDEEFRRPLRRRPPHAPEVEGRRVIPAGHMILAMLVALAVAAVLNAQGMHKSALSEHPGTHRDVASAATGALASVSSFFQTDQPRQLLKTALGRSHDDRISTRAVFARPTQRLTRTAPAKPVFTPRDKLRLYLVGDSLITDPGPDILTRAAKTGVIAPAGDTDTHPATGLVQPQVFNWFEYLPGQVRDRKPDLTVATFGANDGLGFDNLGGGADQFGSPAWQTEYRRRVGGTMDTLTKRPNSRLIWLGLPIPREPGLARRWQLMNSLIEQEAKRRAGIVTYVDLFDRFKDTNGAYADFLPDASGQAQQVRSSDGIHYEPAGASMVADAVMEAIPGLVTLRAGGQPTQPTQP